MSGRPRLFALLGAIAAIAIVVAAAWPSGSKSGSSQDASAATRAARATSAQDEALLRARRPKAVEPVAGESAANAGLPTDAGSTAGDATPTGPASSTGKSKKFRGGNEGPTGDSAISDAVVLKNGIALPPIESPPEVERIIEAGNQIARTPYLWGGGHGKWLDKGYDCSGSVSYALAAAGLLNGPLASGPLMSWGKSGKGKWVTIYSNPGHVFLVVAGVRFDTSGTRKDGSRWQGSMRPTGGYVSRHPAGL
ncbi:MAG: C40 family peptidase [Actinomycetota bacterium]|nr:C40 family peptidase [Actinomycetota bacterium]